MKDSLSLFLEKISLFENHDPRLLIKNKVHLDPKIKSTILAINQSGWCWTLFCCQGHIRGKQKGCIPYVVFIVKNEYKSLLLEKIFNNIPFDVNIDFPLMNNFRVEISPGFKDEKYSIISAHWYCNMALSELQLVQDSMVNLGSSIVEEKHG
jgi:hypothetical protein